MDRDTRLEGLNLHYTDSEKGEKTVVMMHGWGCNHTTLRQLNAWHYHAATVS